MPPGDTDPDDVPAVPAEPVSKLGDVWLLGPHRLVCGDSTDVLAVEAAMAGGRADMVWTDPPYGVSYVGKTAEALTIQNDELGSAALEEFLREAFDAAFASTKPGGAWYVAAPAGPLFLAFGQRWSGSRTCS